MINESLLWQVRAFIYQQFGDTTYPPGVDQAARWFEIEFGEAVEFYKELHDRHAIFLEPETSTIRMANPFSGISTNFRVHANGRVYFANCAWDMLGIPAALHCDAVIHAVCTESKESAQLEIRDGQIYVPAPSAVPREASLWDGGEDKLLVHFPLPFSRWYDDLVFT